MAEPFDPAGQLTLNDIEIGARLAEALVHHVRKNGAAPIGYAELLELGRFLDPHDAAMARAEVLGIAAKLRFVSAFCLEGGYPDLACLAVHPATMRPAPAFAGDWEAARGAVAAFDWTPALAALPDYVRGARAAVPARFKPRKERPAEVSWYAYFCAHREACKNITSGDKREVVNLVMAGLDPETALRRFLAAKSAFEAASS
ncbi:hypothetical protein [Massilia sp. Leaf139]|uniref:hypothetical protein n=1 Tax=Massilia sp. Leaf139 TaxID=1736272 RepID=UPI0006F2C0A2|nr:hypothetical protein [Massilia sp. Leaf139]KQQ97662.1 hypothetical protein ASF77_04560 [Massilia sp. Leaf139]